MILRTLAVFLGLVFVATNVLGQESSLPQPYTDKDSYLIYQQLVPGEETYGNGTKVIQQETIQGDIGSIGPDLCVSLEVFHDFQDAIANYKAANTKQWLLQRQFELRGNYELVNAATIKATFQEGEQNKGKDSHPLEAGWKAFAARYPGAGGIIVLSAVGFNKDKTRAIVYSGAGCGPLCGRWSFHLFKKVNGNWTETPGILCDTVS